MTARPEWEVTRLGAGPRSARLATRFDFGAHEDLLASVPVPARARGRRDARRVGPAHHDDGAPERAGAASRSRSVGTRTSSCPAPIATTGSSGCPNGANATLDGRGIPTGRARPAAAERAPLAGRDLDDLFALGPERVLTLGRGGSPADAHLRRRLPVRAGVLTERVGVLCDRADDRTDERARSPVTSRPSARARPTRRPSPSPFPWSSRRRAGSAPVARAPSGDLRGSRA